MIKEDPETLEIISYMIPDVPQLLLVVLVKRLTIPRKLSGAEIKFVRKVIGLQQKDLAKRLNVTVEHLSRCENGGPPLSPQGEKLLRAVAVREACKLPEAPKSEAREKFESALDTIFGHMEFFAAHDPNDEIALHFVRVQPDESVDDNGGEIGFDWDFDQESVAA
ncbi:MAG: helix-turn-helix domain-containing protein [Pseudomonadota bacterium]